MSYRNISIKLLRTFKAICVYQNFTKAAENLHLSQPAVTKQMKLLEDYLGFKLFNVNNKNLSLTHQAQLLLPKVDDILLNLDNFLFDLGEIRDEPARETITLGVVFAAQDDIWGILKEFKSTFKNVDFEFTFSDFDTVYDMLCNHEIDFAITGNITHQNIDLNKIKIKKHNLYMIAPKSYTHLANKLLDISDLKKEEKVLSEKGSYSRYCMERFFNARELKGSFELNNNFTIINAVSSGFGISLASDTIISNSKDKEDIILLDVKQFPITSYLHLISLQDRKLTKLKKDFLDFVKNYF